MERPMTRTQSYMSKWAVTYQKKMLKRNYLIKNLIFSTRALWEDDNKSKYIVYKRFRTKDSKYKETLFIVFVDNLLDGLNECCLRCEAREIKEVIDKCKEIFLLDYVMRRKYKHLYERIIELQKELVKNLEKKLFSKERLEGKKGEEFLQSVKQYLFRNGNNEYMNFDIYYKMIEEMKQ